MGDYELQPVIYEAIQSDGTKLKFTGELVAEVSAELPEKDRWTEFSLYLTDFNTWILQGVGRSRVKGERDRYWYIVSSDPMDWLDKILSEDYLVVTMNCENCGHVSRNTSTTRGSRLAKRLLREAFQYLRDLDCE